METIEMAMAANGQYFCGLLVTASSIGANYREANRGESRDDFGHKLQIALKEAS